MGGGPLCRSGRALPRLRHAAVYVQSARPGKDHDVHYVDTAVAYTSGMSPADAASPELTLATEEKPDGLLVHCNGRLMGEGAVLLRNTIKPLLASHPRIVLDFTNVAHAVSMGPGAVAGLYVSSKSAGCQLQLVN